MAHIGTKVMMPLVERSIPLVIIAMVTPMAGRAMILAWRITFIRLAGFRKLGICDATARISNTIRPVRTHLFLTAF